MVFACYVEVSSLQDYKNNRSIPIIFLKKNQEIIQMLKHRLTIFIVLNEQFTIFIYLQIGLMEIGYAFSD